MLKKSDFKKSNNRLEGHLNPDMTVPAPSVPEDMCTKCPKCSQMLFITDLEENLYTCTQCGFHFRMSVEQRIALICDENSFIPWNEGLYSVNPLDFPGYDAKLEQSRIEGSRFEEIVTGKASICGQLCAFFVMNADFMMGSMGSVAGEKITRLFERAAKESLPVVGFTASGGARMQEGMYSLMQMAKTSGAVKRHSDAGLLYAAVLTDPTTGGVTASFAMEGDILLAEPEALIAFAGPRVIEQTIRQKLPDGFQQAEYLLEHGFLDAVVPRKDLKPVLANILSIHSKQEPLPREGV